MRAVKTDIWLVEHDGIRYRRWTHYDWEVMNDEGNWRFMCDPVERNRLEAQFKETKQ